MSHGWKEELLRDSGTLSSGHLPERMKYRLKLCGTGWLAARVDTMVMVVLFLLDQ